MSTRPTTTDLAAKFRAAAEWPTIAELAKQYGVRERVVADAYQKGYCQAVRLDRMRVDPDGFAAFMLRFRSYGFDKT